MRNPKQLSVHPITQYWEMSCSITWEVRAQTHEGACQPLMLMPAAFIQGCDVLALFQGTSNESSPGPSG